MRRPRCKRYRHKTRPRSIASLSLEHLEERLFLSARSILPPISPQWFQEVRDPTTPSHVGPASISAEDVSASGGSDAADGKHDWIVRFNLKSLDAVASVAETQNLLAGEGVQFEVLRGLGLEGQVLARSSGASVDSAADWLAGNLHVAGYELDGVHSLQAIPDDPAYSQLWGM